MNQPILRTRCILFDPLEEDGIRISVMSRHTLSDGITQDVRIKPSLFHLHFPILGPSPKLIGDYYKRGLSWEQFAGIYIAELSEPRKQFLVSQLSELTFKYSCTLLCIEETAEYCHRRLLAEQMQKYAPQLEIQHC